MEMCKICRNRQAEGTLVYCYHDGCPLEIKLVCSVCGEAYDNSAELAASDLPYYDDDRPYYYYHGRFDTDRFSY